MPEIGINIEVYCALCGAGLCNQTEATKTIRRLEPSFRVQPCETCLEKKYDAGYNAGYDAGQKEARAEARES